MTPAYAVPGGVQLLELDLGGRPWRLASEPIEVQDSHGRTLVWRGGLEPVDYGRQTESVTLRAHAGGGRPWAEERAARGPLTGRRGRLWVRYPGQTLEEAHLVLQGVIRGVSYADPQAPGLLEATLELDLGGLSTLVPPPEALVDGGTWPVRSSPWVLDDKAIGRHYPVPFGHPGRPRKRSPTEPARPAVPAYLVEGQDPAAADSILLLALGELEATQVEAWRVGVDGPTPHDTLEVETSEDALGQLVSIARVSASSSLSADLGSEWAYGLDPSTGGGVRIGGRTVSGLGDLLLWGALTYSAAAWDADRLQAERADLNRFPVDGYLDDPALWDEIVDRNLAEIFDLVRVHGPRGLYYTRERWDAPRQLRRATLTTDSSVQGYRVVRVAAVEEVDEERASRVTVTYAPSWTGDATERFTAAGREGARYSAADRGERQARYPRLDALEARLAAGGGLPVLARTWEAHTIHTEAAAAAVAAVKVARHARTHRTTTYQGGPSLRALQRWDVVQLRDADGDLDGVDARVLDVVSLTSGAVQITVRVPDP